MAKKYAKKLISLALCLVMVLGLLPAIGANAVETQAEEEVVYLSVSFDSRYIDDKNGNPIAYVPVPLEAIAAIDLPNTALRICSLMPTATANMKSLPCSC